MPASRMTECDDPCQIERVLAGHGTEEVGGMSHVEERARPAAAVDDDGNWMRRFCSRQPQLAELKWVGAVGNPLRPLPNDGIGQIERPAVLGREGVGQ